MDLDIIKKIIKIAEEADISGLTVEQGDLKIEVKREKQVIAAPVSLAHSSPVPLAPAHTPAPQKNEEDPNLLAITSPMVGTFYRAPSPDSSPFVEIGDKVEPGKVVCIIEP
jgi:acetyl-CoA carboxylase biotin carboxyl carrier protein